MCVGICAVQHAPTHRNEGARPDVQGPAANVQKRFRDRARVDTGPGTGGHAVKFVRFVPNSDPAAASRYAALEADQLQPLAGAPWLPGGQSPAGAALALSQARLLPPVEPSKIIAIGRNYADHAAEFGNQVPEEPMVFFKAPSSMIADGETIRLAYPDHRNDHEAELVVVIGKTAKGVLQREALDYVFGYTCGNDVSDRILQKKDGQFGRAKSFDTYTPLGPVVVTGIDPSNLRIGCRVNGETRQDASTKDLIFNVPFLVSFLSNVMTLLPGDIIMTGTPSGVSPLQPGDTCEVWIEGVGKLTNPVAAR